MRDKRLEAEASETTPEPTVVDPYANATSSNYITRGRTGVIFDTRCLNHFCYWDSNHPETPRRLSTIRDR